MMFVLLQVTTYKDELQGQNGPGFAWVLFDSSADAVDAPIAASSKSFTFTDDDKCRVCIDMSLSVTYLTTASVSILSSLVSTL